MCPSTKTLYPYPYPNTIRCFIVTNQYCTHVHMSVINATIFYCLEMLKGSRLLTALLLDIWSMQFFSTYYNLVILHQDTIVELVFNVILYPAFHLSWAPLYNTTICKEHNKTLRTFNFFVAKTKGNSSVPVQPLFSITFTQRKYSQNTVRLKRWNI